MLLIDLSGIIYAALMAQVVRDKNLQVDENFLRHLILNNLRSCIAKFKRQHPEIVVACDNRHYWRKDAFPYYKANRAKARSVLVDWVLVNDTINQVKIELKEFLPYRVLDVDGCEADDIIAVLSIRASGSGTPVLIASNDKDFTQLQKFPGIEQYSNLHKEKIVCLDAPRYLKEHIIRGDTGDGIPNFLSPDDCFVTGQRQHPINSKKLQVWLNQNPEDFCDTSMLRWYRRNEMLIDLTKVPDSIQSEIVKAYDVATIGSKNKMMNYFIAKRLTNLMANLDDF